VQSGERSNGSNFEYGSVIVCPAFSGCSVKTPICALDQSGDGNATVSPASEIVQHLEGASSADLENRSKSEHTAAVSCAVETSVSRLNQHGVWPGTIKELEAVEGGKYPGRSDLENRSIGCEGCPIEIAVSPLNYPCDGIAAVRAIEAVQHGENAIGTDFENCSVKVHATVHCSAVETSVRSQRQPRARICSINSASEAIQKRQYSCRRDLEYSSSPVGAARWCRAVQAAISALRYDSGEARVGWVPDLAAEVVHYGKLRMCRSS